MKGITKKQEGSTIIIALIAIIVLSGVSAAFLSISVYRNREAVSAFNAVRAFYTAEAGVGASIAEITADTDYDSDGMGNVSGSFDSGSYSVTAVDDGNDIWTVTSTGTYDAIPRGIEAVIGRKTNSPFTKGAFGSVSLSMSGNCWSDSYDSDAGTYDSQVSGDHANENGSVGSNGNIVIDGNAVVNGDATPGPDNSVSGGGSVTGSTVPANEETEVAPYIYTPPPGTPSSLILSGGTTTLAAGTYHYASIQISGHAKLILGENDGDELTIYVDGDILISGQGEITISTGASVTIHHGGTTVHVGDPDLKMSGQGITNDNGLPSTLIIYSAADQIDISGKSDFHGVIYAPNAIIDFAGNADFYGSMTGSQILAAGSGKGGLHYDEALARLNIEGQEGFEIKSWREFTP